MKELIKSQDDLNRPEPRSVDVLIKTIEKCEKLEKQLNIAVETITALAIVGKYSIAIEALHQIKELDK
jgi:hypothetical protein